MNGIEVDRQFHFDLCMALGQDPEAVESISVTRDNSGHYAVVGYVARRFNLDEYPEFMAVGRRGASVVGQTVTEATA